MSKARSRRQHLALSAIPEGAEDEPAAVEAAGARPVAEIMQLIDTLEAAVDEKISSIMSAAEDAITAVKNECKRLLVLLPAKTRKMQLADFKKAYPGDFQAEPATSRRGAAAAPSASGMFLGMPLQTPMPFMGEAVALPITILAQKRGGKTKAAPLPEAAIITTSDGKQWALGAEGIKGVPETHRQEVSDLLTAQFNFFAAALGKTVFQRDTTRGSRRR